jgi:group I intron endonuclease
MLDVCGIYLIRNTVNGKVYVGQSVHIQRRWHEHKKCAKWGHKSHLYDAIRKYGADAFTHEILEECGPHQFDEREAYWMARYDCRDPSKGYNLLPAGQRGRVMDADCRERIAAKLRGRKLSPERVEKMRAASLGRVHSDETRKRIGDGNRKPKGPNPLAAAKAKARYAALSAEEKAEYAAKRSGYRHSEEARLAMSAARTGKPKSEAAKANMRAARAAEPEETKAKRAAALRAANELRWAKWRAEKEAQCN